MGRNTYVTVKLGIEKGKRVTTGVESIRLMENCEGDRSDMEIG